MPARKSCWACCKQRLRCDYRQPDCRKCLSRGIPCPGYEKKPLKWLQPGQTRSKGRRARKETAALSLSSPTPLSFKIHDGLQELYEAVVYHNECICPDMVATGLGTATPFYLSLDGVGHMPPAVAETIMSAALGHRIQMLNDNFISSKNILLGRFETHRSNAIHLIGQKLTVPGGASDPKVLVSVLSFLLAEEQFSSSWWQHCNGAYALIDNLGGLAHCFFTYPYLRHLLRYLVLIDLLGSTTSPVIEPQTALRQLKAVVLLPMLFGNDLETAAPCPQEILSSIVLVNYLRSSLLGSSNIRSAAAIEVLHRIILFQPRIWAANIELANGPGTAQTAICDWEQIASIYQSASILYCVSALFCERGRDDTTLPIVKTSTGFEINAASTLEIHRSLLLHNLKKGPTKPTPQVTLCTQYAYHAAQGYSLLNNLWGIGTATGGSQCTYYNGPSGNGIAFSSDWKWQGDPNTVKSYIYSDRVFTRKRVGEINRLSTTVEWSYNITDVRANVAYDIFTHTDPNHTNSNGEFELMIWLGVYGGIWPITESPTGSPVGQVTLAGHTWNLYTGWNGAMRVYSFLPANGPIYKFSADVKEFFNYLTKTYAFPAQEQYMLIYQFGTEAFTGGPAYFNVAKYEADVI
ncbi:Endoglucanase cel12B [Paramyrothecium foliicola]|nr:Endoglucanase cel12B [Paramyrothecium foliicola]